MKLLGWLGAIAVVAAAALGLAYMNREAIFIMIAHSQLPHVAANRPVTWQQGPASPPTGRRPPNIVFILADDMGYNDITFNGGGVAGGLVPTPNINSIGHEGVAFVNGYDGNATCAPSRAAIMTGRYATRFGFEFTPAPVAFEKMVGTEYDQDDIVLPRFFPDKLKDMPPGTTKGGAGGQHAGGAHQRDHDPGAVEIAGLSHPAFRQVAPGRGAWDPPRGEGVR